LMRRGILPVQTVFIPSNRFNPTKKIAKSSRISVEVYSNLLRLLIPMKFLKKQKSSKQMGVPCSSPKRDTLVMSSDGLEEPSLKPLEDIKVSSPK
jgi:hypothetical protein